MTPANARSERVASGAAGESGVAPDHTTGGPPTAPASRMAPTDDGDRESSDAVSAAGDSVPEDTVQLAARQLRSHTRLGTTAVYRVLEWDDELVRVEVVTAPGLDSGTTLSLTREAIMSMPVEDG